MCQQVVEAFKSIINSNLEGASRRKSDQLEAVALLIVPSLDKWCLEQQHTFEMSFSRLLQALCMYTHVHI